MNYLSKKQKIILMFVGVIILIISITCYIIKNKEKNDYDELITFEENQVEEKTEKEVEQEEKIIIHITGEVSKQGIVELKKGSRIKDAVEAAGGITKFADVSKLNLAYILEDGQKIYIPNINDKDEEIEYVTSESGDNVIVERNSEKMGKVNINKATQTELERIDGIGPSTALKIIKYREENGKFKRIEDVKNVSGIGESKYQLIKDNICVN